MHLWELWEKGGLEQGRGEGGTHVGEGESVNLEFRT